MKNEETLFLFAKAIKSLIKKQPLDKITVTDIVSTAGKTRQTFYRHFQDKYDLLEYCVKNIEQELTEKINTTQYSNSKEFYTNLVMSLLEYISENKKSI